MEDILFPYDKVRNVQKDLIVDIKDAIETKQHLVIHAPTGLGKTAAALPVALAHAIKNKLTVFFLTSRHTQHKIAIDTLQDIKKKYNVEFNAVDIIGKKWMCAVPGTDTLSSVEFSEYCKNQRENGMCEYFNDTKSGIKLTVRAKKFVDDLKKTNAMTSERIMELSTEERYCPYEISLALAKDANVIIADYYYIFDELIRKRFFGRTDNELGSSIIIVDEGHNLPNRVREVMSVKVSDYVLERAIKEARKFEFEDTARILQVILDVLKGYEGKLERDELLISRDDFIKKIELIKDFKDVTADLYFVADDVMEKQKKSFIFYVANFLQAWIGQDKGFARIFSKKHGKSRSMLQLSYRCLDPSLVTRSVIENSYSTILMSGTLNPTSMYKDVLGFPRHYTKELVFESPFPDENKLNMVVPITTTKYTSRGDAMYKHIAQVCAQITNDVPGNSAVFFPSYYLRDEVYKHFYDLSRKTNLREQPGITKQEKLELLERFKLHKDAGAVLLGVASGSYGEGIDLPGDLLKCVVVVGLPLQKPDLETKELIQYYDHLFGKGWDYGYLFPAFNKTLQSAGRCIRSEDDRGVVVFLDERYAWRNYARCFPRDSNIVVSTEYSKYIQKFFEEY